MRFLGVFLLFLLLCVSFVYGGQSDSIFGKYIIQEGCGDARSCCCIQGRITISGTDGATTVSAASELRAVCPGGENNPPTFTGSLTKSKEGYTATTTIRGESFSIVLSSDKLSFQNSVNKGATCSFAARRIPSNSDEGKPCKNPTKEQVTACINNWNNLPACEKGQEKDINTSTCCPVCRPSVIPPRPKCSMEDIDRCGSTEKPVFNNATGCPSCAVATPGKDCPNADIIPSVVCPPGVPPSRTANSCVSCKETKDSRKCSKEQQKVCDIAIDQGFIPRCASGIESTFNITTCCRTCIKSDDNDEGPKNKQKCTKDEMNACMASIPVCQDGEKPFANKTKCCPSCRRPERGCKLADVTVCKAAQRVCASGELPSHIDGECCATCKLPPPTCNPACNSSSICVPNVAPGATADQIQNAVGKCLPKRSIKAKFNLIAAGAGYDASSVAAILTEIINRYCDKAENADKCSQLTAILNAITIKLNSADITSGNVDATIELSNQIPSGESTLSRSAFTLFSSYQQFKLLADSDADVIVTDALNDPSSVDTVTVTSVSIDNGSQSGAASHYPSIIIAAVTVLVAFLKY